MKWKHSRKGIIEGDIAGGSSDSEFVTIILSVDHPELDKVAGERLTVRESFLTELSEDDESDGK